MLKRITQIKNAKTNIKFLDDLSGQDPTHPYYGFLHELIALVNPKITVELGVCTGRGTAHLAHGNTGVVIAVDPAPWDIQYIIDEYPNILLKKERSDSSSLLNSIHNGSVDICFFDSLHDYGHVKKEFELWYPKVRAGGVMLFDDITLNEGMKKFWQEVNCNKVERPDLHWSGYGVAVK